MSLYEEFPSPREVQQEKERIRHEQAEAHRSLAQAEVERADRFQKRLEWAAIGLTVIVMGLLAWKWS